ncbi:MAG: class I SAM-dependent methyltransferase [Nitrospira sp.]|nr:class I SAM-dependent methyltransferase [Nitrospira sp.]
MPTMLNQRRHDQRAARLFRRVRRLLGLRCGEAIRHLDIGCSSGALIKSALREGILSEGVEPAEQAARSAQVSGLRVFHGTLESAHYPSDYFHTVTLMEVIEHLADPAPLLREARRILVPHGLLVVGTGNVSSWTVSLMGARWDYF